MVSEYGNCGLANLRPPATSTLPPPPPQQHDDDDDDDDDKRQQQQKKKEEEQERQNKKDEAVASWGEAELLALIEQVWDSCGRCGADGRGRKLATVMHAIAQVGGPQVIYKTCMTEIYLHF